MVLELQQQLRLTQQLIMTPQLQMAIKLLQLSRLELMEVIRQEMEENPAIEEMQETTDEETSAEELNQPVEIPEKEVTVEENLNYDIDWNNYIDEYSAPGNTSFESEEKDTPQYDTFIARHKSLSEHLHWQFLMTLPSKEEEKICTIIVGNLDSNGYLKISSDEIANLIGCSSELVEDIIKQIQIFDPIGLCGRDLKECLLIQARHLGLDNSIITEIIEKHLNHLQNKNYNAILRALRKENAKENMEEDAEGDPENIEIEDVIYAANIIRGLEPRPGCQFSSEEPQYISPDIFVYKEGNEFVIMLNDDGMPRLKISNFYKDTLKKDSNVSGSTKNYIKDKLRSATWLIKSIHQRQRTIYKVVESIMSIQREFFEKGVAYLKPMILKDIAKDIDMHESTISRVTTNKYVHTPQGIFELKYFFNSSIKRVYGEAIASTTVKEKIRQIIQSEDKRRPYSDEKIAQLLKHANIEIARRTVAKYRELLRILPSSKRKQI
ncbi:RNA polymerase sigma-54 factor [Candidatus Magnetomoraceae bacterium gMMP-1]